MEPRITPTLFAQPRTANSLHKENRGREDGRRIRVPQSGAEAWRNAVFEAVRLRIWIFSAQRGYLMRERTTFCALLLGRKNEPPRHRPDEILPLHPTYSQRTPSLRPSVLHPAVRSPSLPAFSITLRPPSLPEFSLPALSLPPHPSPIHPLPPSLLHVVLANNESQVLRRVIYTIIPAPRTPRPTRKLRSI